MQMNAELVKVLRRVTDTYFGDDRPWEMVWGWRFLNALFGVIVFSGAAAVVLFDLIAVTPVTTSLVEVGNLVNEFRASGLQTPTMTQIMDSIAEMTRLLAEFSDFVNLGYSMLLLAYFPAAMGLAAIIASGIKHGGPLRLFLLGVTVPGLIGFVIRNALATGAQLQ